MPKRSVFVVVDAQKGFADPAGSLAYAYGVPEIAASITAAARIAAVLGALSRGEVHALLVRSEYEPGQFTKGRLHQPLSLLCVPRVNVDSEWTAGLDVSLADAVITKRTSNAMESPHYQAAINQYLDNGAREFYFAGFQLTSCLADTALATHLGLGAARIKSRVVLSLSGARRSSYSGSPSRVAAAVDRLQRNGIEVVNDLPSQLYAA